MSKPILFFLAVVAPALSLLLALLGLETLRDNLLGWFLLACGVLYPAGGIIYFFIRRRPFWEAAAGSDILRREKGDLSFWLILPGFIVVFFAPPLGWLYLPASIPHTLGLQVAGLSLILASILLRLWARAHIRGLYSVHVEVRADHHLVQTGPYRFIRHPGYAGFVLMALGVALGYSSWIGLVAVPVLLLPALVYRLRVEEVLLSLQLGEPYRAYSRKTHALIPGIW